MGLPARAAVPAAAAAATTAAASAAASAAPSAATPATASAAASTSGSTTAAEPAAASAEAAATATAAEPAAPRTLPTLLGFVHTKRSAVEHGSVELVDRAASTVLIFHRDEAEPARLPGHPVEHHFCLGHFAARLEGSGQRVFSRMEGQIAHVQPVLHVLTHSLFRGRMPARSRFWNDVSVTTSLVMADTRERDCR
jgi:hypothetical protein